MSCAKTAKPIETPFRGWTRQGPDAPDEGAIFVMRPFVKILRRSGRTDCVV